MREVGCLFVTVSLDAVTDAPGAIQARTQLDNRCDRAADVDLGAVVARGRDAHTREARLLRLGARTGDHFALARATTVVRAFRFDAPLPLGALASVCVDLGRAVVDESAVAAACFVRDGARWTPEP